MSFKTKLKKQKLFFFFQIKRKLYRLLFKAKEEEKKDVVCLEFKAVRLRRILGSI
jgi:hypothetical protein